jgi:hypothetical protein
MRKMGYELRATGYGPISDGEYLPSSFLAVARSPLPVTIFMAPAP